MPYFTEADGRAVYVPPAQNTKALGELTTTDYVKWGAIGIGALALAVFFYKKFIKGGKKGR